METPERAAERQPLRKGMPRMAVLGFLVLIVGVAAALLVSRWSGSRPQLDVRNAGTRPVLLRHRGDDFVVSPRDSWSLRFSRGDTLTTFAGESDSAKSRSVTLEPRGPLQGTPPRVRAEINADDAANIVFRYADGK